MVYCSLNPGKTWIGWASDNNGGELEIIPNEPKETEDAEAADGEESSDSESTETEE